MGALGGGEASDDRKTSMELGRSRRRRDRRWGSTWSRPMRDDHLDDTKPDLPVLPPEATAPRFWTWKSAAARTPAGCGRTTRTTSTSSGSAGTSDGPVQPPAGHAPEEDAPPGYGFAVADGMGGHAAGEIASRVALTVLVDVALQTPDWILGRDDELLAEVMERTARRFQQVNEAVLDQALSRPGLRSMGTTLSLALSLSDALIVAHVGDSRRLPVPRRRTPPADPRPHARPATGRPRPGRRRPPPPRPDPVHRRPRAPGASRMSPGTGWPTATDCCSAPTG